MKIYTRTGDSGETGLFGGGRVPKDHIRVEAYGEVDEVNSVLGLAIASLEEEGALELVGRLRLLQQDLFAIGAHLATPTVTEGSKAADHLPPLPEMRVRQMESWIDEADEALEPLRNFILPGGTDAAARLHLARTVCRRAERRVLSLAGASSVERGILVYLNRLSDLLFTLARVANRDAGRGDALWKGEKEGEE